MTEQQIPQNAEQWYHFLSEKQPPVRLSIIKRLQKKLADPNCSVNHLSKLIKSDPLLCFHVALAAGRLHDEKQSEITSIDHAIGSLGMHKLEQLINSLPTLRLNPASTAQKMYFRAVANSHHAATQVHQWLKQCRGGMFAEESYLAALFYNIGHWLLWYFAPQHMVKIQIMIREKDVGPELAETRVLGCTIDGISKRLLSLWPVSSLARVTLENSTPLNRQMILQLHQRALSDPRLDGDQLRQLNHLTQQKFFPVKLGNLLALTANYGWGKEATLHLIDIINDYLRGELNRTFAFLHRNCVMASRNYHVAGTLAPAAEMLMLESDLSPTYRLTATDRKLFQLPHDKSISESAKTHATTTVNRPTPPQRVAAEAATDQPDAGRISRDEVASKGHQQNPAQEAATLEIPAKAQNPAEDEPVGGPETQPAIRTAERDSVPDADFLDKNLYRQYLQRFNELGDYYSQGAQVLNDLLKALIAGLGMQRAALIILPPKSNSLKVVKATGFADDHPLPHSTHILGPKSLFSRLNEKPGCLLINQTNREQVRTMLPATFSRHVSQEDYLLMSLIASNRSVVIIYADRDNTADGVQTFHHKKFKDLCNSAGRCLDHVYKLRAGAKK
ncbi:HD-like signal output (HDOD) domain, no enzymatic activity [Amphritea atlantica]|uniref:HD-like signal output (HDOD) domain, no enzymatic activity n=1 Tax=Amphritea atlantica TaxID=355243 RepID=A0A1H9L187_9GAMM|nr:HDOD domain-containing protein [Amphritea atlantica]SER05222.1 HD-like signal output (HDOD) domain, no enzymatic activity [Amphritea atlantica]